MTPTNLDDLKRYAIKLDINKYEIGATILNLIAAHEQLQAKLDKACEALELIHLNFRKVTKCPDNTCDGCFMDAKIAAEKATKTLLEIRKKDK